MVEGPWKKGGSEQRGEASWQEIDGLAAGQPCNPVPRGTVKHARRHRGARGPGPQTPGWASPWRSRIAASSCGRTSSLKRARSVAQRSAPSSSPGTAPPTMARPRVMPPRAAAMAGRSRSSNSESTPWNSVASPLASCGVAGVGGVSWSSDWFHGPSCWNAMLTIPAAGTPCARSQPL